MAEGVAGLVGTLIWVVANAAYYLFRSNGEGGFKRFVAFWMGVPLTWLTLIVVREGVPMIDGDEELPLDAEMRRLRAEIADDRAARGPLPDPAGLPDGAAEPDSGGP